MKNIHKTSVNPVCWMMILPMVVLFFLFHTLPFLQGIFYSFTDWKGYGIWKFVGLRNYLQVFRDPSIRSSYLFTFKFALAATILVNILSLLFSCGLNSDIYFRKFLRAVYFIPYILGTLIISYVFRFIFANIVPAVGTALGISALQVNILGTEHAWWGILIVTAWQSCAFNTLIYLSGLQSIDPDIYEAAALDGAKGLYRFFKITFPCIAPFFTINLVLCVRGFLMAFDQIMGLTSGGPGTSTTTISVLLYKRGFQGGQFAYQSANAVMLFAVVMVISIIQLKLGENKEKKYEY
ncbi:MAG TPA: sugar ABC transporter permease [Treponema sp.]|nr:sugar ABC transporter permease [Treponema sp.]